MPFATGHAELGHQCGEVPHHSSIEQKHLTEGVGHLSSESGRVRTGFTGVGLVRFGVSAQGQKKLNTQPRVMLYSIVMYLDMS